MKKKILLWFVLIIIITFNSYSQQIENYTNVKEFEFTTINNLFRESEVMITGYNPSFIYYPALKIPPVIQDKPVTSIDEKVFAGKRLSYVFIPESVRRIGSRAFAFNDVVIIEIGENVSLGRRDLLGYFQGRNGTAFDNAFDDFYNVTGKRAGTYYKSGNKWTFEGEEERRLKEQYIRRSSLFEDDSFEYM